MVASKIELLKFLDSRVFNPILKATPEGYSELSGGSFRTSKVGPETSVTGSITTEVHKKSSKTKSDHRVGRTVGGD